VTDDRHEDSRTGKMAWWSCRLDNLVHEKPKVGGLLGKEIAAYEQDQPVSIEMKISGRCFADDL
jgi:hypothetical protein